MMKGMKYLKSMFICKSKYKNFWNVIEVTFGKLLFYLMQYNAVNIIQHIFCLTVHYKHKNNTSHVYAL